MSHVHRFLKVLKNKWTIAGIVIFLIIVAIVASRGGKAASFESVVATKGNVIEKVSVTGTVSPLSKADLAFKKSGVIAKVYGKVGDRVKKGDVIASIDNAADRATLISAQAQLDELKGGLRPEEYALYKSNLDAASTTLANAQKNAINASLDAYIKTQSAVVNYADTFFFDAQSINPRINIPVQSSSNQTAINVEHVRISDTLSKWKKDNDAATTNASVDPASLVSRAEEYITTVKTFMSNLSVIVNGLNAGNSGMSQATIDSDVSLMNTGLSTMAQAITTISTADTSLKNAQSAYTQANQQFNLQLAGSSSDAIVSQEAKVYAAQAAVNDDSIISPIDGLITKADPAVGEFVTAGQSGFAVQSSGGYKIEAFVPEADIAKVSLKDGATITLDAYGSYVFFPASVSAIDPAETILQGVPTYKVTLYFDQPDNRIRSGMTANTDILTHQSNNTLVVPSRAVVDDNGKKSVRIVNADGKTYTSVPVSVGLKGSEGTTEILSGVHEGDKVVTYVK